MKIIKLDVIEDKGKFYPAYNGKRLYGDQVTKACNFKIKEDGDN